MTIFPEMDWKPWLFGKAPYGFWENSKNQRVYMEWFSEKVARSLKDANAWYDITREDFLDNHGTSSLLFLFLLRLILLLLLLLLLFLLLLLLLLLNLSSSPSSLLPLLLLVLFALYVLCYIPSPFCR